MKCNLSVVLITKNEEANIRDCLECVTWADEIIVIDSFSTDATVSIAREYTPLVVQRQWPGMVGTQRNIGLDMASSEWLLFLDADERVTGALKQEILELIRSDVAGAIAGGMIPRKNYFFGRWMRGSYPNYTARFLRKERGRYNEKAGGGFDTMVFGAGKVIQFKNPMVHLTGESLEQRLRKLDADSGLVAGEKFRAGKAAGVKELFFHPLAAFVRMYFFKRGILDGMPGFIYASLHTIGTFVKYARLWELCNSRRSPDHDVRS